MVIWIFCGTQSFFSIFRKNLDKIDILFLIFYFKQVSWMSQTVSNGNANSNREVSFMGGPKVIENNEDIGDTDDIPTIHEG